ncbi:M23 family metallopeptidase [Leptospira sp. GIMC2001]|uniref:M23 family metallopeptidase n=1 Tax=Leptospira sp. GIMC2001 TaxID=1513297 RepID=UPI00234BBD59|nr:M23 family metallopeptidase [Leptospira sp. GIMC2001]WCL49511.1 M23 family metallopeptidase [Leptospira sp. GIMC2001]
MDSKKYLTLIFYRLRYKFQEWKLRLSQQYSDLNIKGREKLTIMVIPHTERKTVNFVISYKAITIFLGLIVVLMFVSAVNVLSHSGSVHELTELNLSNIDFQRQSEKLKEEVSSLHSTINYYYDRISSLYIKLGGDPSKVSKGIGGASPRISEFSETKSSSKDLTSETYKIKEDIHNLKLSRELSEEIINMIKKRKSIIKHTPSVWPTRGYVLFPYGKFISPITGKEEFNKGLDIAAFPGSEIVSTAPGLVYEIGQSSTTGYYIKIAHKFGWKTIYSNLDRVKVNKNEKVSKGDVIGYVGKSSENPIYHVHYEVHVGTQTLNPFSFLNQIQE